MLQSISVNQFRDHLKEFVDTVNTTHIPLVVTRRSGPSFVVVDAEDWAREQETIHVLQNQSLMKQIALSSETYRQGTGRTLTQAEQDEIDRF